MRKEERQTGVTVERSLRPSQRRREEVVDEEKYLHVDRVIVGVEALELNNEGGTERQS